MSGTASMFIDRNALPMPILKPVRIPTKHKYALMRLWIWLTAFRSFELVEDYTLYIPWLDVTLLVPAGFVFDGASVPRFLWPIFAPTGVLFIAAIFHDFSYRYNTYLDSDGNYFKQNAGKLYWDGQFRKMNEYITGLKIPSYLACKAVQAFGWLPYWKGRINDCRVDVDFAHKFILLEAAYKE